MQKIHTHLNDKHVQVDEILHKYIIIYSVDMCTLSSHLHNYTNVITYAYILTNINSIYTYICINTHT